MIRYFWLLFFCNTEAGNPGPKSRAYGCGSTGFRSEHIYPFRDRCLMTPQFRMKVVARLSLLHNRACPRSLQRFGLEEATALLFPGRASFRLKEHINELASVPFNTDTRDIEGDFFLRLMCFGASKKPIEDIPNSSWPSVYDLECY